MSTEPAPPPVLSPAMMIRRALFVILLFGLAFFYLALDFRGLSHAMGMEQAQIAREIARSRGFSTKCIRPVSLHQVARHMESEDPESDGPTLLGFKDTYHAPLNPLLNSILLRMVDPDWKFEREDQSSIFFLDQVIAAGSMVLLLSSIGVCYLLICRVFDQRIGGVTALLMLFCELLWQFSQSGLPQMLMLFLFSFALYFLFKALENVQTGKGSYLWIGLTGGFFGLLALSHWITIWMFVGLLIFVAIYFIPRGIHAVMMFTIFIIIVIPWGIYNYNESGNFMGSGLYAFYSGISGGDHEVVMRNLNPEEDPIELNGFMRKVTLNTIAQIKDTYVFLGSIVVAPLFFIGLLHPFKRPEIAHFRWCILIMWVSAAVGMAILGLRKMEHDSNQLHILFMPIMTAYGLAFLSVLWNRLNIPLHLPVVRNGHFVLVVLISAMPLLLTLPWDVRTGVMAKGRKANWPPYVPRLYHDLATVIPEDEIVITDIPWAIAWYTDRTAVWLPKSNEQLEEILVKDYGATKGHPIMGVLFTPETTFAPFAQHITNGNFADWRRQLLPGAARSKSYMRTNDGSAGAEFPFQEVNHLYDHGEIMFFSDRVLWPQRR